MGFQVKRNTGRRARDIAYKRGIPIVTVQTIIKDYLDDLVKSAENGERVIIDGITTIDPVKHRGTGEVTVRGRVSEALRKRVRGSLEDTDVELEEVLEG